MTQELYTLMLLEIAVLGALVLISFMLYRANPHAWLLRWNFAWLLYLLHMPASFMEHRPEAGLLAAISAKTGAAQLIATAAEAAVIAAIAILAGRGAWVKRIWIFFGVIEALSVLTLVVGSHAMLSVVGTIGLVA